MIVRERYMRLIRDFMDKPVIKIITGMRRSGKSALLELTRQELLDRGVDRKNIIFINFESLRYEALRDYKALYAEIIKIAGQTEGRIYVLLDEIQEVNTWEQVINSLRVDLDCDIYVTGSMQSSSPGNSPRCWLGGMWRYRSIRWILKNIWHSQQRMRTRQSSRSRSSLLTFSVLVDCPASIS